MTPATRITALASEERCHIHEDGTILFADAFGRVSLALAIEDEFGIADIPEDEAERCITVSDWVDLVGRMNA